MKAKILLLSFIFTFAGFVHAEKVPLNKALQTAAQYYRQAETVNLRSASANPLSLVYEEKPAVSLRSSAGVDAYYYVFNIENDGGFIIISGDNRAEPVLGYSTKGNFDVNHLPPPLAGWLQMFGEEIATIISKNPDMEAAPGWKELESGQTSISLRASVGPLNTAEWDQGEPYNRECPTYTNNGKTYRCVTGCVATAMAIVLKYHADNGHPAQGTGSHSYEWSGKKLSVNFGSYDWANMPNKISDYRTENQKAAVAKLMYHCGVSLEAFYGNSTSASTSMIPYALSTYFGMEARGYKSKSQYSDADWTTMIKEEINQGRPIVYRGKDPQGGHAFVCDGYNDNSEYHINWGWGGYCNGSYRLSALQPSSTVYNFSSEQGMVTGIQQATRPSNPENASLLCMADIKNGKGMSTDATTVEQGKSFNVTVGDISNSSTNKSFSGQISIAVMDASDKWKETVATMQIPNLNPGYFFDPIVFTCTINQGFSETDVLRTVSSTDGGKTWKIVYGSHSGIKDFLPLKRKIEVASISLNETTKSLIEDQTFQLIATVKPDNATDKAVTWSSNNQTVATVDNTGLVTAKVAGTAIITVTTTDGGKTATCAITVSPATISVTGVSLNTTSQSLTVDGTFQLTATVSPANATNKTVAWSSDNTTVAEVSDSGLVTAKAAGTATITVTTADGNKTATCALTITPVSVTGVTLNTSAETLMWGDTFQLTAIVTPDNAANKEITWTSDKPDIATVDLTGLVTAKAAGTATITVTTADGNKTATCVITVTLPPIPTDGLVAYFPFNGNANDMSGNNSHGTVHGATLASDRFGKANSAYYFDGKDDYIDGSFRNSPKEFTISLWYNPSSIPQEDPLLYSIIAELKGEYGRDASMGTFYNSLNLGWGISGWGIGGGPGLFFEFKTNSWYHLVFSQWISESDIIIYIKMDTTDSSVRMKALSKDIVSYNNFCFGYGPSRANTPFYGQYEKVEHTQGVIDDIRIYNRQLTDDEIFALYLENSSGTNMRNQESVTSIKEVKTPEIQVSVSKNTLRVNSPSTERIDVYSVSGVLVYQAQKAAGEVIFDLNHLPKGVLIVRGSSGWARKVY